MDWRYDPSLMLYLPLWDLDGASFMSRDPRGHLCTATGATWGIQGRIFDGLDDKIDIPKVTNIAVLAWVQPANTNVDKPIYVHGVETGEHRSFGVIARADAHFGMFTSNSGFWIAGNNIESTSHYVANTWYMVGGIYDTTYNILYVNGVNDGQVDRANDGLYNAAETPIIGRGEWSAATVSFNGTIGAVWIYNRVLSAREIMSIYLATKWRYQG